MTHEYGTLYVSVRITWHGERIPKCRQWFATLASDAFGAGRFYESRTELHAVPITKSRQASWDLVKQKTQYKNCSVQMTVLTEGQYADYVASEKAHGEYIQRILNKVVRT